jgi:hypothetical protein
MLLLFVIFFINGCTTVNYQQKNDVRKYDKIKHGKYNNVVCVPVKDFVVKGIVFVESKVTIDANGEKTGSEITNEMLMREAQKLGADDVINVKIDEIEEHKVIDSYAKENMTNGKKYYKTGSGELAVIDNYAKENMTNGEKALKKEKFVKRKYKQYNYIYKATGLAIKYTKAITKDQLYDDVNRKITSKKEDKNLTKKKTKVSKSGLMTNIEK